jgi:hypothetical protein
VYDRKLKVWTKWDIGYVARPKLYTIDTKDHDVPRPDGSYYGAGMDDTAGVMKLSSTDSDNGTAINGYFETGWFNFENIGDKHRLRRLELTAEPEGDEVDLSLYRNFSRTAWKTGVFTPTGSLDGWHEQQDDFKNDWWSWLKVRVANDDIGETFQINGIGFTFSTRKLLRGPLGGLNA